MFAAVLGLAGISGVVHSLVKDHDVGARTAPYFEPLAAAEGRRRARGACRRRGVGRHAGPVGVLPVRDREQAGPEGCDRRGQEGCAARSEKTDVRHQTLISLALCCAAAAPVSDARLLRSLTGGGVPAQGDASPVTAAAGCLCTRNRPNGSFVHSSSLTSRRGSLITMAGLTARHCAAWPSAGRARAPAPAA